jgi:hypothetical protein
MGLDDPRRHAATIRVCAGSRSLIQRAEVSPGHEGGVGVDSQERIDRAVALKPASPGQTPVAPLIIHYTAQLAGVTQADIFAGHFTLSTSQRGERATRAYLFPCRALLDARYYELGSARLGLRLAHVFEQADPHAVRGGRVVEDAGQLRDLADWHLVS